MRSAKPAAALVLTGIGSALVIGFHVPAPATGATTSTTTASGAATSSATGTSTSGATATAAPEATTTPASGGAAATTDGSSGTVAAASGAYADGTYTGTAVDEPWGTFQVQAVVSGGRLTDVVIVSAPTDGHSSRINDQAIPVLTEAAIAAQGADVDVVSGATWTSRSYATSLQAALDAAAAAAAEQAA